MVIRSQWRSWLCLAAILGVIFFCSCHRAARAEASATHMMQMALAPSQDPAPIAPSPPRAAPFGLTQPALAAAPAQSMAAKWASLQAVVAVETRALALCRQTPDACTPAAKHFGAVIDAAKGETGRARIGVINRAINLAIRFVRDNAQFGIADVWQSPLMTFASGSGDCEDYAIAKYVALREAGISASDLKFVIVRNDALREDHAVTAARIDGEWLILDNRKMLLLTDAQASDLNPLIALGDDVAEPALTRDARLDERFVVTTAAFG